MADARRLSCIVGVLLGWAGCGESAETKSDTSVPECSGDFDRFETGMKKEAAPAQLSIELTAAEPTPPAVRSDNVWQLRVTDERGTAVTGAELFVTPYMPEHQHGSAEVVVSELGDGLYRLAPIELIMPGVWEIPVSVTPPDGETSETTFRFCIAER